MNEEINSDDTLCIMTLGISSVGKTSFIFRFTENKYQNSYFATVGIDYKIKDI